MTEENYIKCFSCNVEIIDWDIKHVTENCHKIFVYHCNGCHTYCYDDIVIEEDYFKYQRNLSYINNFRRTQK